MRLCCAQTAAVAIPKKAGSHGSIGDRRQLIGSASESEPPMSEHAMDLFSVIGNAGSRSAPNSHRDTFDKLSVASLASLQPLKKDTGGGGSNHEGLLQSTGRLSSLSQFIAPVVYGWTTKLQ